MPGKLTAANGSAASGAVANGLTKREHEIVQLATTGLTNQAIARELAITEGTVKLHLHNVYQKLGIKRRAALAARMRDGGHK